MKSRRPVNGVFRGIVVLAFATIALPVSGCIDGETADSGPPRERDTIHVFAAASFADVVGALGSAFSSVEPDLRVSVSLASSSVLARQIANGAPADVFLSADHDWVDYLRDRSKIATFQQLSVTNRITLFVNSDLPDTLSLTKLASVYRIAVGDPEHVPVGRYARELLECAEVWQDVSPSLVPTADARAALQLLKSGAVGAALGYVSDADFLGGDARAVTLPERCQPVIRFGVAVTSSGGSKGAAYSFAKFVTSRAQLATWARYGFVVTGSGAPDELGQHRRAAE